MRVRFRGRGRGWNAQFVQYKCRYVYANSEYFKQNTEHTQINQFTFV